MNAKELFALIVRVIGLVAVIYLVRRIVKNWDDWTADTAIMIVRVVCVLIGLYFVRGASLLVKFAYPEKLAESAPKTS